MVTEIPGSEELSVVVLLLLAFVLCFFVIVLHLLVVVLCLFVVVLLLFVMVLRLCVGLRFISRSTCPC